MASNNPRRIPESKAATHEELTDAINGITENEWIKLNKAAGYFMRGSAAINREVRDLINETVLAFFKPNGRIWKKGEVDIVRTLHEAMRSVASNWRKEYQRKIAVQAPLPLGRDDDPAKALAGIPVVGDTIQDRLEDEELLAAMRTQLAEINELVAEREMAALIIMAMTDGMDGAQIRKELELTVQQHETEILWIRRKVRAKFKGGRVK
ncbi:MAG: hypothetical protein AB7J13_08305 [Pyrinomonadaceae bacterium]